MFPQDNVYVVYSMMSIGFKGPFTRCIVIVVVINGHSQQPVTAVTGEMEGTCERDYQTDDASVVSKTNL